MSIRPSVADSAALRFSPGTAPRPLVIGTRGSLLAQWQTDWVRRELHGLGVETSTQTIETRGDRDLETPLPEIGAKGLFTAELEAAMRAGTIDAAVHSLKDLPVEAPEGLVVAAVCRRADPRDVLVSSKGTLATLPKGARVGTSSRRRAAQLLHVRPDLRIVPLRGNVETRIRKALGDDLDAAVLAGAGVARLGMGEFVREHLEPSVMLPAPGQGAIAVQCRADDREAIDTLRRLDDPAARAATTAERAFLHALGGGCSAAIGAFAEPLGETGLITMSALVASPDGRDVIRIDGSDVDPVALGQRLARRARARGADELLR